MSVEAATSLGPTPGGNEYDIASGPKPPMYEHTIPLAEVVESLKSAAVKTQPSSATERQTLIFDADSVPNPANIRVALEGLGSTYVSSTKKPPRWVEVKKGTTEESLTKKYRKELENIPDHKRATRFHPEQKNGELELRVPYSVTEDAGRNHGHVESLPKRVVPERIEIFTGGSARPVMPATANPALPHVF